MSVPGWARPWRSSPSSTSSWTPAGRLRLSAWSSHGSASDGGRARASPGTAAGLADLLESLLVEADGVRLHPASLALDLDELSRLVLPGAAPPRSTACPALQDGTFRDLLGLDAPGQPLRRLVRSRPPETKGKP